jgi:hypothetical protein
MNRARPARSFLAALAAILVAHSAAPAEGPRHTPRAAPEGGLSGTLFQTARERADLERLRQASAQGGGQAATPSPAVVNGVVRNSEGLTLIWIDGVIVGPIEKALAAQVSGALVGNPDGRLVVKSALAADARHPEPATKNARPRRQSQKR